MAFGFPASEVPSGWAAHANGNSSLGGKVVDLQHEGAERRFRSLHLPINPQWQPGVNWVRKGQFPPTQRKILGRRAGKALFPSSGAAGIHLSCWFSTQSHVQGTEFGVFPILGENQSVPPPHFPSASLLLGLGISLSLAFMVISLLALSFHLFLQAGKSYPNQHHPAARCPFNTSFQSRSCGRAAAEAEHPKVGIRRRKVGFWHPGRCTRLAWILSHAGMVQTKRHSRIRCHILLAGKRVQLASLKHCIHPPVEEPSVSQRKSPPGSPASEWLLVGPQIRRL